MNRCFLGLWQLTPKCSSSMNTENQSMYLQCFYFLFQKKNGNLFVPTSSILSEPTLTMCSRRNRQCHLENVCITFPLTPPLKSMLLQIPAVRWLQIPVTSVITSHLQFKQKWIPFTPTVTYMPVQILYHKTFLLPNNK